MADAKAAPPGLPTATFNAGDALSSSIDCTSKALKLVFIDPSWTSACLSFQISGDNVTFFDLHDAEGNETTLNVVPGSAMIVATPIGSMQFGSVYIKFRSGSAAQPVPQQQAVSIAAVLG